MSGLSPGLISPDRPVRVRDQSRTRLPIFRSRDHSRTGLSMLRSRGQSEDQSRTGLPIRQAMDQSEDQSRKGLPLFRGRDVVKSKIQVRKYLQIITVEMYRTTYTE